MPKHNITYIKLYNNKHIIYLYIVVRMYYIYIYLVYRGYIDIILYKIHINSKNLFLPKIVYIILYCNKSTSFILFVIPI